MICLNQQLERSSIVPHYESSFRCWKLSLVAVLYSVPDSQNDGQPSLKAIRFYLTRAAGSEQAGLRAVNRSKGTVNRTASSLERSLAAIKTCTGVTAILPLEYSAPTMIG
jgi:hypothetical protein